ncbi:MAG: hypothetical protein KOO66_06830 [Bacteroidales bacterium]|nr:hypothetical protein [Bacteroidales bacterium]
MRNFICLLFITFFSLLNLYCQAQFDDEIIPPVKLMGPRLGFTYITPGETVDQLAEYDISPILTQFGWQFETRFFTLESGVAGLIEGIILIGGVEQNTFLPSGTFLIGIRNAKGLEFGLGPNVSVSGVAFALAAGVTLKSSNINFPINIAVVPSDKGVRLSLLFGFNARQN